MKNTMRMWLLFLVALSSCAQMNRETATIQSENYRRPNLKRGQVHYKIYCDVDSSVYYSLFLPKSYTDAVRFPIVYFFDPHAHGDIPLNLYKDLADKYGYIIVGSGNIQNGLPWTEIEGYTDKIIDDTKKKFSIDNKRVFACGFSGGARVAGTLQLTKNIFAGIVGCSAGLPNQEELKNQQFSYLGIVGNEDFNYTEMKFQKKSLDHTSLIHDLVVFEGKHSWPPYQTMEIGFDWLTITSIQRGVMPRDSAVVNPILRRYNAEAESGDILKKARTYVRISHLFDGVTDITPYERWVNNEANQIKIKNAIAKEEQTEQSEFNLQQFYTVAFQSKDLAWWSEQAKLLQNNAVKKTSLPPVSSKRILNYLSIAAYSMTNNALNVNYLEQVDKYLKIYAIVDPDNPDISYLRAIYYMKKGNQAEASKSLQVAISKGFNDLKKLASDNNFKPLHGSQDFTDMLQKLMAGK